MGFFIFLFKSLDATAEIKKTVKVITKNTFDYNGLFTHDVVSPDAFLKMYITIHRLQPDKSENDSINGLYKD